MANQRQIKKNMQNKIIKKVIRQVSISAFILFVATPLKINAQIDSMEHWVNKFNQYQNFAIANPTTVIDGYPNWSRFSKSGWLFQEIWQTGTGVGEDHFDNLALGIDALLAMYEATDSIKFLDSAMAYTQNLVDNAHTLGPSEVKIGYLAGFPYKGWYIPTTPTDYGINNTSEIKPVRYILRMCRMIADRQNTLPQYYVDKAKEYINFFETNVWNKWAYYVADNANPCPIHITGPSLDKCTNWAYFAYELYYLSHKYNWSYFYNNNSTPPTQQIYQKEQDYKVIICFFNYAFKSAIEPNNTALKIDAWPAHAQVQNKYGGLFGHHFEGCEFGFDRANPPAIPVASSAYYDVSHANFMISTLVENYSLNFPLTSPIGYPNNFFSQHQSNMPFLSDISQYTFNTHIQGFVNTVKDVLWNDCDGSLLPQVNDGTTLPDPMYDTVPVYAGNNGVNWLDGWIKLGRYSCELQMILDQYAECQLYYNGATLTYPQWTGNSSQFLGNMALNAKILSASQDNIINLNGTLTNNIYTANNLINVSTSNATVPSTVYVNMKAGNEVHIYPGFHAEQGSNWHAYIQPGMCFVPVEHSMSTTHFDLNDSRDAHKTQVFESSLTLHPNPNNGQFRLFYSNANRESYHIIITDALGQNVYDQISNEENLSIDLSAQSPGIYFVTVQTSYETQVKKVIIE
jgi:hypothetical protein